MKKFLKENIVLALGITLPIFLIIIFILIEKLPAYFVADPQYDFIYANELSYFAGGFKVENGKLYIMSNSISDNTHLYRYSPKTGTSQEIFFEHPAVTNPVHSESQKPVITIAVDPTQPPTEEQAEKTSKIVSKLSQNEDKTPPTVWIPIKELDSFTISTDLKAPDGYQFVSAGSHYSGGGLFTEIIGGAHSSSEYSASLIKNGRAIPIANIYSSEFIGWIVHE